MLNYQNKIEYKMFLIVYFFMLAKFNALTPLTTTSPFYLSFYQTVGLRHDPESI